MSRIFTRKYIAHFKVFSSKEISEGFLGFFFFLFCFVLFCFYSCGKSQLGNKKRCLGFQGLAIIGSSYQPLA